MDKDYEIVEHTADVAIRAFGRSQAEAFANAARAMFSQITELDSVRQTLVRQVEVEAPDRETLLVAWLNELVFLFDTEQLLFSRFEISAISDTRLEGQAFGEKVDRGRHELKIGIKSATYHKLKVEPGPVWCVEAVLDI
jgi:SHS2 domain-containing protein